MLPRTYIIRELESRVKLPTEFTHTGKGCRYFNWHLYCSAKGPSLTKWLQFYFKHWEIYRLCLGRRTLWNNYRFAFLITIWIRSKCKDSS